MHTHITHLLLHRLPAGLLPLLLLVVTPELYGQLDVSGTVTGDDGYPLIGVTVRLKEVPTSGTVTDLDGSYTITVPDGESVLLFSYTGYAAREEVVNNRSVVDVVLNSDAEMLDEVVVVGYGYVDKNDLTGSVTTVKNDDLTRVQSINFEKGLAAQAAGVQVTTTQGGPGAAAKIRIRGGTSINATNDPLYVVDGFPLVGDAQSTGAGPGAQLESPLSSINPEDIESIEILKDASSTAIYGSRGANGVIIITTKKGREGQANLSYTASFGIGTLARSIDLLSPQEYVDFYNEYFPFNNGQSFERRDLAYRDDYGNDLEVGGDELKTVNWRDRVLRNSTTMRHSLSVNGGSSRTRYSASFSYTDDQGILEGSYYKRYTTNINVSQELANNLVAGINLNAGVVDRGGPVTTSTEVRSTARASVITQINLFPEVQGRIRYEDAEYDEDGLLISVRDGGVVNPETQIANTHNYSDQINGFGNTFLEYRFNDKLSVKSTFGGRFYNVNNEGVFPSDFGWSRAVGGIAFTGQFRTLGWLNENTVSYRNNFGVHGINAVAGFTQQGTETRSLNTRSQDFALPGVDIDDLASAGMTLPSNSSRGADGLRSWLGRINYTLKDKYLFTISGRADGSSKFANGNKWGFFPSAAVSWRVSQEPFLKNSRLISNLKLRATYGISGNNSIGNYQSLAAYEASRAIIDGRLVSGARVNRLGNPDLTWETTSQTDIGFELGLFENRLTVDFDYYVKTTDDLLLNRPLPPETGFTNALQNFGTIENRGVELALNATPVDRNDFRWNFRFNISRNENEVLNIGEADFILASSPGYNRNDFIVRVGDPVGSFYGYEVDGVYNYSDFPAFDGLSNAEAEALVRGEGGDYWENFFELGDGVQTRSGVGQYRPGMIKLRDIASFDESGNRVMIPDGVVNEADRTILGSPQPDWFGGITNDFKYKRFDLSFLFQFSVGNETYNNNIVPGTATAIPVYNKFGIVRDRWRPDTPENTFPGIWGLGDGGIQDENLSLYIEDGSFLRLANVTLGYRLPPGFATMSNARVYLAIDNAFLLSDYSGYDPEVSVGGNQLTPGVDSDSYPRERTFRGGVSVTF